MAQDTTAKKNAFLAAVVSNAVLMKAARDQARALAEEFSKDATVSGIQDTDCVGANSHLTRTIVLNYLTAFQPNFELILAGTPVTPGAPYLPNIMACIPS